MSEINESLELEKHNSTDNSKHTEKFDASLEIEENLCEGSGFCDEESTNDPNTIEGNSDMKNEYEKFSTAPSTGPDIVYTKRNSLDASDATPENDLGIETTNHTNDHREFSERAEIKSTEKLIPVTTEIIIEPKKFSSSIDQIKVEGPYSSTAFTDDIIRNTTINPIVKQPTSESM